MENNLYDLVLEAQKGDQEAMQTIITLFMPAIKSAKVKVNGDRQQDLEQAIIETLIKKICTYDISNTPDFTSFTQLTTFSSTN